MTWGNAINESNDVRLFISAVYTDSFYILLHAEQWQIPNLNMIYLFHSSWLYMQELEVNLHSLTLQTKPLILYANWRCSFSEYIRKADRCVRGAERGRERERVRVIMNECNVGGNFLTPCVALNVWYTEPFKSPNRSFTRWTVVKSWCLSRRVQHVIYDI
jgi:hypothetical protein